MQNDLKALEVQKNLEEVKIGSNKEEVKEDLLYSQQAFYQAEAATHVLMAKTNSSESGESVEDQHTQS